MIVPTTNLSPHQASQPDARVSSAAPTRTATATPPPAQASGAATPDVVKQAVSTINQAMQQSNRNLEFTVDGDTDQTVVRLVDTSTGELIRQYPSEATLAIAREIDAMQQGLLLKREV